MKSRILFSVLLLACVCVHGNYANVHNTVEPPPKKQDDLCPVKELKGEKGDAGPAGSPGMTGPPGAKGVKGDQGQRGDKGEMGAQGGQGRKGSKGVPGADGKSGTVGSKGAKGEEGRCDAQCGNVKKLESQLKTLEYNYTQELAWIKQQLAYLTTWVHPLGSKENPAVSCKEILKRDRNAPNGPYYIKVNDTNLPGNMQEVYCIMSYSRGCPRGLTQVLKIDGSQNTFRFSSPFWTNKNMFMPGNGKSGCDFRQTKLATYWSTPFESICVRMRPRNSWWIRSKKIDIKANSLYDLIAPGKYTKTNLNVKDWKALLDRSSLQTACTKQGFNVKTATSSVRIGVVADEKSDCKKPDSYIGVGTEGSTCGRNPRTSCGNEAGCGADGGDQHIQSMGYIYVY